MPEQQKGEERVIELHVRITDVPVEGGSYSDAATKAMYELADGAKAIVEKHGLGYRSVGYGIPRGATR